MIEKKIQNYKIRPFSIIYGGTEGPNYRFFIKKGDYNKFLNRYDFYGNYPTPDTYGRFDYLIDYSGEIVLDFDIWSDRLANTHLQEYVYPLTTSINLTEGVTNIYIKIPKMPAGVISEGNGGLYNFIKPSVLMSSILAETYIAEIDQELSTIVDAEDFLFVRSNDVYEELSSYNIELPLNLSSVISKGYLYIKVAQITINPAISIKYFWTSDIINLNRYSSIFPPLLRGVDVYANVEIGSINGVKQYSIFQYSRADWIIKTLDRIKESASQSVSDIESAILNWGDYSSSVDEFSFSVKEIWITYIDKIRGKPKVERLFYDSSNDVSSIFDELYTDFDLFNPNYLEVVTA